MNIKEVNKGKKSNKNLKSFGEIGIGKTFFFEGGIYIKVQELCALDFMGYEIDMMETDQVEPVIIKTLTYRVIKK